MGTKNLWILLVVVLALGGLVLWQQGRERSGEFAADRPLFTDARPERIRSVRVDQLERSLQMRIVRDAEGAWEIVDPLTFPAETGVLERLLEAVTKNRATPVERPDLAALSLAPPRALVELVEELPAGPRTLRLELGAKDLDGQHVFVRADGVVLRTLMNVDTSLDRDLAEWRRRRVLTCDPARVVAVHRSGKYALDPSAGVTDFGLDAASSEHGWQATRPFLGALDPELVGALLTNACYLQSRGFLADSAVEAERFRLDEPDLRLELELADGSETAISLRHDPRSETWACRRDGSVHVFKVDASSVVFLSVPSEAFPDPRLVRAERDAIERIELARPDGLLTLRRDGKRWMLGLPRQGDGAGAGEVPADSEAVLDLLGAIEGARAARFLEQAPERFALDGEGLSLSVIEKGRAHTVEFGAPEAVSPGVAGRMVRRPGESVVGVVEERVARLALRPAAELVGRQMIQIPELGVTSIELSRGEVRRVFVRDGNTGRWSPKGADAEAPKAFLKCVERLLSLRADVAVGPGEAFELAEPWTVVVTDGGNVRISYRLGALAGDPAKQGFDDGSVRGIVTSSGLFEDLARIP